MGKVVTEAQEKSGDLNKYLIDIFKNHKIIKIFQREKYENERSEKFVDDLKEKSIKIFLICGSLPCANCRHLWDVRGKCGSEPDLA